jgi:hypothetical protein
MQQELGTGIKKVSSSMCAEFSAASLKCEHTLVFFSQGLLNGESKSHSAIYKMQWLLVQALLWYVPVDVREAPQSPPLGCTSYRE